MSSAITTGHLCYTANGREKGLPVGWSREEVRTGLLCYADSKGTPPLPIMQAWSKQQYSYNGL